MGLGVRWGWGLRGSEGWMPRCSTDLWSVVVTGLSALSMAQNPMSKAVADFAESSPEFGGRGLGVTVNAERWNGRHAMFGIFAMVMTSYMKGHGLIPDADKVLDIAQWGPLAAVWDGAGNGISNERAIILIAHVH
eukprot:3068087-Rhodomonas_salina.1